MITLGDLLRNIYIDSEFCVCQYDLNKERLVIYLRFDDLLDCLVHSLYVENGMIFIEL